MIRAYKYRIYPNSSQGDVFQKQFTLCRWLYNSALEERITAHKAGKAVFYRDQQNQLPEIKEQFPEFNNIHSQVLQDVLKRLDNSFKSFFRRIKQGNIPGFPRFKGQNRFLSISYPQSGFKIIGNRVFLSKIGSIKIKLHRPIEGIIKTCSIKKEANQWYVVFVAENKTTIDKKSVSSAIGIDLGLENFAVLSSGIKINNPRHLRNAEEKLKVIQSKYCKHKGKNAKNRLSILHRKIANQRIDFLHKQSRIIVNAFDLIAYEDLNIKNMIKGRFAKSIHDVGWGKFIEMIKYKAESAGVYAIAVNPRRTSQICSGCQAIVKKELYERQHNCPVCGLSIHRDLNASINIERSGIGQLNNAALQNYSQSHV